MVPSAQGHQQRLLPVKLLANHIPLLQTLKTLSPTKRTAILPHLQDDALQVICHCIRNALLNKKLTKKQRQILRQRLWTHRDACRYLSRPRQRLTRKARQIIPQIGEGLGVLLASTLPLLVNFVSGLFTKKKKKKKKE